ncbi:MAG TPA: hypothetical protein VFM53_11545 [Anaeromyxobacteraceae bacterium]|nr:hypothetical protein [Anaeromyxobacteraceae bacterium]
MKVLLVIALIHGLVPAFGELAEMGVHYATTGHLAHSESDHGDLGDQGAEHGCSPTAHHCACCAAQPLVQPNGQVGVRMVWNRVEWAPRATDRMTNRSLDPPFRPPIA